MADLQFAISRTLQHAHAEGMGRRGVVPAPVGGWNTQDAESAMEPHYAVHCENYFPHRGRVISRRGTAEYADLPVDRNVGTLFAHEQGGTDRFYAFTDAALYDVTDPDSITEVVGSGITSEYWRGALANGQAIFVNGEDAPIRIDSSGAEVAHGFSGTGLTVSDLTQVTVHQNRLFFVEKDSTKIWYSALNAVTGALSSYDVGLVNEEGGNVVAVGSLTRDTGIGVDDLFAIFMSSGHVLIYAGTDPSSANTWSLSGIFQLGRVIGDRSLVKLGGDLIVVTADGYIPLLQFLSTGREQRQLAISDKIAPTVTRDVELFGDEPGWQAVLYPEANWLLFNVPQGGGIYHQHVQNVQTGAWCLFTGMNAASWAIFGDKIYYGTSNGKVVQADTGGKDGDMAVCGLVRTAYNYLQSPYDKQFRMLRMHIESGSPNSRVSTGASVDFDRRPTQLSPAGLSSAGTAWNVGAWNSFTWAAGVSRHRAWRGLALKGSAISLSVASSTSEGQITWYSSDILYNSVTGAISQAE